MKPIGSALCIALFSVAALAETPIPAGTVVPIQLNHSVNTQKLKAGQIVTARVMQDVPLPNGKIPRGAKVSGHVLNVQTAVSGQPSELTFRFDTLSFKHSSFSLNTNLRALASTNEVEDAQVPSAGPDRGTPWAWWTRNLIGGEVAYGEGGPVSRGEKTVGYALSEGVLVPVQANSAAGCRGSFGGVSKPQAMWVFSSDACGLYGFDDLQIVHAGRSHPVGEITLRSKEGNFNLRAGSGILLRVNGSEAP